MKKLLVGTLIALSASLVQAASSTHAEMAAECDKYIDYVVSPSDRMTSLGGSNVRVKAAAGQAAPIDCAVTPYVLGCETLGDPASAE